MGFHTPHTAPFQTVTAKRFNTLAAGAVPMGRYRRLTERVRRRLNDDGGSGRRRRRRGDGLPGRSQVQQRGDRHGHLGEPPFLQDVKRKTQLTLHRNKRQRGRTDSEGGGVNRKAGQMMANQTKANEKQNYCNHGNTRKRSRRKTGGKTMWLGELEG